MLGVYTYDYFLSIEEQEEIINVGKKAKHNTNEYFLPTSTTKQVVHHNGYSLSYNEAHEQAEWVAYELKKSHLSETNYKRPYFEVDKAVKTGAAHWRNYKNSGYDRGHLCPAGDRRYSQLAHDETFLTSNISPQEHKFNAGIWNTLEQKVRYWANKYDGVFVVTGDVTEFGRKAIGDKQLFGLLGKGKSQIAYAKVTLNIVDVTTSEVVYSVQGAGEYSLSEREVIGFGSTASYDATLNGKVLDLAIRQVVDKLVIGLESGAWKVE